MEETRWRGRFQKQHADTGIYNARDLMPPIHNRKGRKRKQMGNTMEGEATELNLADMEDGCLG